MDNLRISIIIYYYTTNKYVLTYLKDEMKIFLKLFIGKLNKYKKGLLVILLMSVKFSYTI